MTFGELGFVVVISLGFDWAMLMRISSSLFHHDDTYRYWPMSKARVFAVILLLIAMTGFTLYGRNGRGPRWLMAAAIAATIAWAIISVRDMLRQP
jgi:hypothetical protein